METNGIESDNTIISKYSPSGGKEWTITTDQSGYDVGREISVSADGSVYITGVYDGGSNFFGNTSSQRAAYLLKYDSAGNYVWSRYIAQASAEQEAGSVFADSDGFVYVTGSSSGNLGSLENSGGTDIFIEKYSSSGELVWSKLIGSPSDDRGT